jgi:iduronate 2-sulfatase
MRTRRQFLREAAGGLAGLTAASSVRAAGGYNVLFLAVDDLRPELGCYGNGLIRTPNLDRLAVRSLVFDRAYCQQAVCGASRASLLTGLRPDTTRVWGNDEHYRDTVPGAVTLPERFKQAGWRTRSFGKILHGKMSDPPSWTDPPWPEGERQAGMQYVDTERLAEMLRASPGREFRGEEIPTLTWKKREAVQAYAGPDDAQQDGQAATRAIAALREWRDERFFLAVGFLKPHLPFTAPKKYFDMYDPRELPAIPFPARPDGAPDLAFTRSQELRGYTDIPNDGPIPAEKARELIHGYYAAVSYMDAQAGRVLDELDRLGLTEKTVVVLFGDHGFHLGEQDLWAKSNTYELDNRAPLILRVPGMAAQGAHCERLVEFVDIYPTLCEACGVEPPEGLEGLSLMPLAAEPARPWKSAAFSQFPRPYPGSANWKQMGYSIRTERHRYTEWVDRERRLLERELYDYEVAPSETVNLAGRPEQASLVAELSARLAAGWREALPQ